MSYTESQHDCPKCDCPAVNYRTSARSEKKVSYKPSRPLLLKLLVAFCIVGAIGLSIYYYVKKNNATCAEYERSIRPLSDLEAKWYLDHYNGDTDCSLNETILRWRADAAAVNKKKLPL